MESAPGEDAVKTVEILAKDLDYYINLVDKAAAESERNDFNFKSNSTQGKMLPSSIACYREVNLERKNQSRRQTSLLSYVKKLPPTFSTYHPDQSVTNNTEAKPSTIKKDYSSMKALGLPGGASGKEFCQCRRPETCRFNSWIRKTPWRRK